MLDQVLEKIIHPCEANICNVADDVQMQYISTEFSKTDLSNKGEFRCQPIRALLKFLVLANHITYSVIFTRNFM